MRWSNERPDNNGAFSRHVEQKEITFMSCVDCKHKVHEPGKCSSCNCGESSISHAASRGHLYDLKYSERKPGAIMPSLINCGHVVPKRKPNN